MMESFDSFLKDTMESRIQHANVVNRRFLELADTPNPTMAELLNEVMRFTLEQSTEMLRLSHDWLHRES